MTGMRTRPPPWGASCSPRRSWPAAEAVDRAARRAPRRRRPAPRPPRAPAPRAHPAPAAASEGRTRSSWRRSGSACGRRASRCRASTPRAGSRRAPRRRSRRARAPRVRAGRARRPAPLRRSEGAGGAEGVRHHGADVPAAALGSRAGLRRRTRARRPHDGVRAPRRSGRAGGVRRAGTAPPQEAEGGEVTVEREPGVIRVLAEGWRGVTSFDGTALDVDAAIERQVERFARATARGSGSARPRPARGPASAYWGRVRRGARRDAAGRTGRGRRPRGTGPRRGRAAPRRRRRGRGRARARARGGVRVRRRVDRP